VCRVQEYLQNVLCPHGGCTDCHSCQQIAAGQHHSVRWFCPERYYTRDILAELFHGITLSLEPGQQIFFVLRKADFFNDSCANALLKPLEEPPPGYHFILLARRTATVLPTIRSRCVLTICGDAADAIPHPQLFDFITAPRPHDARAFLRALEQSKINERESVELLDALLRHWAKRYEEAVRTNNAKKISATRPVMALIERGIARPPMPGGSKIFWRDMFLQLSEVLSPKRA